MYIVGGWESRPGEFPWMVRKYLLYNHVHSRRLGVPAGGVPLDVRKYPLYNHVHSRRLGVSAWGVPLDGKELSLI
jgi:hypothetical protein